MTTTITGIVNAVEVVGGTLVVKIGNLDVPVASLIKVSEILESIGLPAKRAGVFVTEQ